MPTELKELVVEEISLVDKPANPGARVILLKRDDGDARRADRSPVVRKENSVVDIRKALDAVSDGIEKVAKKEFPDLTVAAATAKFLATPAGARMYELHDALTSVTNVREVDPNYAVVEAIADGLIAKGKKPVDAYVEAFDRVADC